MSTAPDPQTSETPPPPPRRGPPKWGILLFLGLLAAMLIANSVLSQGGEPIRWIENDLDQALRLAEQRKQRVFLYLYDPNDPVHARNEREIFAQRWAKEQVRQAVSVRVAVRTGDRLATQYGYKGRPLFALLNASGQPTSPPQEGGLDQTQFFTYIGKPAEDHAKSR
jgi:hypothetical protein